jgi:CheY-like chemotaxis protein
VRASRLTSQLLAFGRKQVLQPTIVDLGKLVADIGRMLERLVGEDVVLTVSATPGLWPIRVDPGQIEQVILNLAANARDAMPRGGRLAIATTNVEVAARKSDGTARIAPGRYVRLAMSDTGVGMDEKTRERIFEPFFTTKEMGKGTGLGLATVYGIVEQSGGVIQAESEIDRGTTFTIYFPALSETANVVAPTTEDESSSRGSETILLVEDEPALRSLLSSSLRRRGYTVYEASAGNEALRLFAARAAGIHLVVMDVVMPGLNGGELAKRLRAIKPDLSILFMSGYTDDAVVRHGIQQGDVAYLEKPFTLVELAARVRGVLD